MTIRHHIASMIPDTVLGVIDYFRFPNLCNSWGGPFNGQIGRQKIFEAIIRIQKPSFIIETGTYRGDTTELLASAKSQVITIEGNSRNYGFSRTRLRKFHNVRVLHGDSRALVRHELENRDINPGSLFAYLDAHWNADLPLAEEIAIVFRSDPEAIVMIDDFQVPNDPGYGFDNYGDGKTLNAEYISQLLFFYGLSAFYPVLPSSEETGSKRGCVILAPNDRWHGSFLSGGLLQLVNL